MYNKSTDFGDYYKQCILKMLLSYGEYAHECVEDCEIDGYRAALEKLIAIFISDYREYVGELEKTINDMRRKHDEDPDNVQRM